MPSGAKKRKALKKKKKQQESISTTTTINSKGFNGDNLHGHDDEHRLHDERESDLSSPGSQRNEDFGTEDPSSPLSSPAMVNGASKEISVDADVAQGLVGSQSGDAISADKETDKEKITVEELPISSSENSTHNPKNVACQVLDSIEPIVSVSKVMISEKSEHVETSTHSNLVKQKSEEYAENPSPGTEKDDSKVVTLPGSATETSQKVESMRGSEIPISFEEKHLLLPGPPVVRRTSWLSCCGLFDAMSSDR